MNNPKFFLELWLAVVTHYLNSNDGYRDTATRFGVGRTAVRRWVSARQQHGIDGLTWKTGDYTPKFRLKVVRAVIDDKLSLRDATAKFNLPNESTVYQWINRFQASQSLSRKGNCLDNAMTESFFGTLKSECFYLEEFSSIAALREAIDAYIHYYNHERISLRLNGLSPVEFRLLRQMAT